MFFPHYKTVHCYSSKRLALAIQNKTKYQYGGGYFVQRDFKLGNCIFNTCDLTITARLKSAPPLILTHLPHQSSEGGAEAEGEGGHNGAHIGVEMNYNEPFETAGKNKVKRRTDE